MREIKKQDTENGELENKILEKALEIREKVTENLEDVRGRNKSFRGPCGHCTGCHGNENYYEYAYKFSNFSIERNSCYYEALVQRDFGEEILPEAIIHYLTEEKIGITDRVNTEEVAEILIKAEVRLDEAIEDREEKRKELEQKL